MMNNQLIKCKIALFLIILGIGVQAQEDPMYTQYMFNTQTYNPAYAGTWETIGFMALSRHQWIGIDGHPSTQTLSMQSPIAKEKMALGLNVVLDRIGKEKKASLFGDYSYKIKVDEKTSLRLGLKYGFTNYSNDLPSYVLDNQNDPAYQIPMENKFLPNFGVGAFLWSEKYYVGFAVPKLIQNKFGSSNGNYSSTAEFRHFFLNAGMVFNVNEWLKFKPTLLTKATLNAPVECDLSANFLINEALWLGAMYRTNDAWGAIAQIIISNKLRLGYAIDFTLSDLKQFHDGIHEIMISYELGRITKKIISPRYF